VQRRRVTYARLTLRWPRLHGTRTAALRDILHILLLPIPHWDWNRDDGYRNAWIVVEYRSGIVG
jgi:hypothetical protein